MALVSLGAAAFTLCSMFGFLAVANMSPAVKFDPSRMAANVASGVGFIGAGVITNNRKANGVYDRESSVKGLTTAAAIWVAAAVGVSSGVGLYYISAFASLGTICILRFGRVKHMGETFGQNDLSVGSKKQKRKSSSAIPTLPVESSAVGASTTTTVAEPSDTAMISTSEHLLELGKTSPFNNNPREIGVTDELLHQEFEAGESMASAAAALAAGFPKQSSPKPPTKTSTPKASSSADGKSAGPAVSQKKTSTKSSSSKASNKTVVDGKPLSSSKTMKDPLLEKYLRELERNEELSRIPDVQLEEDILVPRKIGGESRP
jgi:putative Mg2+ transporter-C (MgtC) family protein